MITVSFITLLKEFPCLNKGIFSSHIIIRVYLIYTNYRRKLVLINHLNLFSSPLSVELARSNQRLQLTIQFMLSSKYDVHRSVTLQNSISIALYSIISYSKIQIVFTSITFKKLKALLLQLLRIYCLMYILANECNRQNIWRRTG